MQKIFTSKTVVPSNSGVHQYAARIILLLLLAGLLAPEASAQFRASIQGAVTDTTGAVIQGATVTLTDLGTNKVLTSTTNAAGLFNFNALPPDRFSLTAEKSGFQKQELNDIELIPEQANSINVQLSAGAGSQTVTVNASDTPALDTETANISGTISDNQIQHMPSFGRDVFQLTQLAPGVFGDGAQGAGGNNQNIPGTQSSAQSSGGSTGIFATENGPQAIANGGQTENNGISIDGISTASAVWGGSTVITPTEDSIGNVKVVSNGYDAEVGRFSGAQIQVTSKTGTNNFHGSLFIDAHRPGLNAYQRYNGPFAATAKTAADKGLLRDNNRFNQIGGSVGGPIWKNRIFAFFAYETIHLNSSTTGTGWYDTTAFDASAPAGSIASRFLTFPGAGVSAAGGIISSSCSNIGLVEGKNCLTIPGQGLDIGSPLKSALGTHDLTWGGDPNHPGVGSGLDGIADIAQYTTLNPTISKEEQYNGRLDSDVTTKDHAAFAIYWVPVSNTKYAGSVRAYNRYHHSAINDAFSGIWNHTFSPSLLNEARVNAAGWRWNEIATNPQEPFGLPQANIGILNGPSNNLGSISLNSFGAPGPSVFNQWTYSYKDVATRVTGRHVIKFGGDVTRLYYLDEATYAARPGFNFFNIWDFLNDAPQAETGTFNPLTGVPTSRRQDDRQDFWGFFAQDDFKVRPNLTLTVGLRYSYFGPLSSKENNTSTVVLGSGAAALTGLFIKQGGSLWKAQKANVGPQLGFAWSPDGLNGKMVLRGGYGLNYNQEEIAVSGNTNQNPPLTVSPQFIINTPTSPNPGIVYAIPSNPKSLFGYPANPNTIISFGSNGLPTTGSIQVTAVPANLPTMYTQHFSLDTQYDLGHQLVATLGYQGSLSRHTYFHYDENALAAVQGIPLNPTLNSVNYFGNSGHGNYHAMLAGLKHQFSHQFMADAEFSWSKSMDTSSAPYSEQYYPYDSSLSYGRSDYNVGKAFKLFGLWQPVFFHGSHAWVEKVAGGWSLSGIYNLHTGFPWNPVVNVSGGSLYCSTCGYSQLLPAAYLGGAKHDTSNDAFKSGPQVGNGLNKNFPRAATDGNASAYFSNPVYKVAAPFPATGGAIPQAPGVSRNSLTGPGYRDVDATITKSFGLPNAPVLGESAKIELRVDAFNIFNNLNFNPANISTNVASANFGQDTAALSARTVSIQARFSF